LKGLEVSEVLLSEAISITGEIRWDSEYYQKKYLVNEMIIKKHDTKTFKELCNFIKKGIFDLSPDNYLEKGVPLIRTSEIKNPTIDFSSTAFISDEVNKENIKTNLLPNDLVFTKIGAYIGDVALLPNTFSLYNFSQNVAGASVKNKEYSAYYLTFFLSKIGKNQILRSIMLSGQGKIELEDIRNYKIPIVSEKFIKKIKNLFEERENLIKKSTSFYYQAEELLLKNIGLKDFRASKKGNNIKSIKVSFLKTGRLDAEYYQLKYEEYFEIIERYSNGYDKLNNVCNLKDNNFIPKETKEYQYIELSNIGSSGNITDCMYAIGKELPSRARRKVKTKDVIISSIEGSLESCALVTDDYNDALCSTGFYVINSHMINSETLLVLFKSEIMQNLLKQNCSGTILTAINKQDFLQIPVPLIDNKIQQKIKDFIQESFELRRESEKLLEKAKEMVEKEIEGGKFE
jgi:restriction endonuclease S subunit